MKQKIVTLAFLVLLLVFMMPNVWQIKPTQATTIFSDGFEPDFTAWTGTSGTPTIETTIVHSGTYAANMSAQSQYCYYNYVEVTNAYARFYVYISSYGSGELELAEFYRQGWETTLKVQLNATNHYWALYPQGGTTVNSSSTPSLNTWYSVEVKYTKNTVNGGSLWVDDIWKLNATTTDYPANQFRLMAYDSGAGTINQYYDDVVIADAYIGSMSDTSPPIFGTISTNSTLAGNDTQVSCLISDGSALSAWGFAWNNTGVTVNASKVSVSGASITALYNGTWNETAVNKVWVQFWANDSSNNVAYSSVQTFTLTSGSSYLTQGDGVADSGWTYRISQNTTSCYIINSAGAIIYNTADSGTTINQAVKYAHGNGSQSIYVYPDTYLTTVTIGGSSLYNYQYSNVYLMLGDGTIIQRTGGGGAGDYMVALYNYGSETHSTNFTLTSNGTAYFHALTYASGFDIYNTYNFTMINVYFDNLNGIGGQLRRCRYPKLENITLLNTCVNYTTQMFVLEQVQYGNFTNLNCNAVSKTTCLEGFYIGGNDYRDLANGWDGTYFNTFEKVWVRNMRRNGFYLCGTDGGVGTKSVANNTFNNCTIEGNAQDGYFGIKLRPAQNNTFTNVIIRNMTGGVTTGTAYDYEGETGNCTGNYVQAIMYDIGNQPFTIATDGGNQEVTNNFFNLTYSDGPRTYFFSGTNSTIHDNIVYMNFTDTNGGIYLDSGYFTSNTFYLNFSRTGNNYADITHYETGWTHMTDNTFNIYFRSGNTQPLLDFVNGTQNNYAYYPYSYSGPPPVLFVITITNPTNTTHTSGTIAVTIFAEVFGGTLDIIWWNCTFTNGTVAYANTTYTVETSMILGNGTYLFGAMANSTEGNSDDDSIIFTVAISSSGAPSIGTPSASTKVEASTCTISSTLTDDVGLVSGILSTNRTSAWVNNTAKSLSGLSYPFSDTVVLPSATTVFGYKIFVSDSAGQWTTSSIYTFITTSQGSTPQQGPPNGGYSRFLCMFTVSSNGRALQDLKIRLWENNYSVLIETLQTDSEGYVETELPSGTYEYSADFGGQTKRGYVLLDDAKKITIDFDSAQTSTFDRSSLIKVAFALVVVACAIVAVLAVKNRH